MSAFIKIRIKIWDEFNFGQASAATSKTFARIPFQLFRDMRFLSLSDSSRFHFIRLLISCQNTNNPLTISRRSLYESSSKTSHSLIILPLINNQLIEIVHDTVIVKRREEKNKRKKRERNKGGLAIAGEDLSISESLDLKKINEMNPEERLIFLQSMGIKQ